MLLEMTQKDKLHIRIFDSREEMGKAAATDAAEIITRVIAQKGVANLVFAAAPSQNEFLAYLQQEDIDWGKVNAFHMDEYIGLAENAPQRFGNFLRRAIFDHLPFRSVSYLLDGDMSPEEACAAYARQLLETPPDAVFLGIGENGHLAFNDPGEADFFEAATVKIVQLDEACRQQQVNDGCFATLADVPQRAITLTIPMLMRIPHALCIVPGETKARALQMTAEGPVTTACPASILRAKEGAVVYTERAGSALLKEGKEE
ncbi:MAG: glucosamine-6-phosphate deaminase [Candidatus Limiplasma sp.]|nr:glucosamine-6-phosphate deaminase [Candidatus Limiplasma sp.]